jgi:hypothetical protein
MGYSGKLINYTNALDIYRDQTLSSMAQCIQLSRYQTKLKKITNYFENLNGMHSYVRFAHGVYLPRAIKIFKDLKPKRVFYDFESVMLASRIFDHTPPFLQTVVQVSIIVEEFGEIKRTRDIVIDPKNFTINDFKTIIDAVDCGDDYSYVVYNKAFENTQLKNMNIFIDDPIYTKKINTITADANCFDLMDFFNVDKQLIIIEKLKGHYSIKDVLRFINEYYPEFLAQSNSVSYTNLNIHNGVEATNTFALRFLGYIDDST